MIALVALLGIAPPTAETLGVGPVVPEPLPVPVPVPVPVPEPVVPVPDVPVPAPDEVVFIGEETIEVGVIEAVVLLDEGIALAIDSTGEAFPTILGNAEEVTAALGAMLPIFAKSEIAPSNNGPP